MVQIIQEKKMPSMGERLGAGVGRAASSVAESLIGKAEKDKAKAEMNQFADVLDSMGTPMHKTLAALYRMDAPIDQKNDMAKALTGVNPYNEAIQSRLAFEQGRKFLTDKLDRLQERYKTAYISERDAISEQIKAAEEELEQFYMQFKQNPFTSNMISFDVKEKPETSERTMEMKPGDAAKVKFDPSNAEHKAEARQLNQKFKGDRKKVDAALREKYTIG